MKRTFIKHLESLAEQIDQSTATEPFSSINSRISKIADRIPEIFLKSTRLDNSKQYPVVDLNINQKTVHALIDSGAFVSLCGATIATEFQRRFGDTFNLKSLSRNPIQNDGIAVVKMQIGNTVLEYPLVVVPNEIVPTLLLGWDFIEFFSCELSGCTNSFSSPFFGTVQLSSPPQNLLRKMKLDHLVSIDTDSNEQDNRIGSSETKITDAEPIYAEIRAVCAPEPLNWKLRVKQDIELKPRTTTLVPITTVGLELGKVALIKPSVRQIKRNGLFFHEMAISAETTAVPITNTEFSRKLLCTNTKIGNLDKYILEDDTEESKFDKTTDIKVTEDIFIRSTTALSTEEETLRKKHAKAFKFGEITPGCKDKLMNLLFKYDHAFSWTGLEVGGVTKVECHLDVGNTMPIVIKPKFPRSFKENQIIDEHIQDLLERGVIQRSSSPYSCYPFIVYQNDHEGNPKVRIVFNYTKLNTVLRPLSYPLPRIDNLLAKIRGKRFLSNLDLKNAYHQIPLDDSSRQYTAFQTNTGLFEFLYLPFGLNLAPGLFSQIMDQVLRSPDGKPFEEAHAYIDDIIVTSDTEEQHLETLEMVLSRLAELGFRCSPSKCNFMFKKLTFLGFETDAEGLQVNSRQLDCVRNLPEPRTRKELQRKIGFLSYFRKFIRSYSKIAGPLEALLSKDAPKKFTWEKEHKEAFAELKKQLLESASLNHFIPGKGAVIETDGSKEGVGAVLYQVSADSIQKPVGFT